MIKSSATPVQLLQFLSYLFSIIFTLDSLFSYAKPLSKEPCEINYNFTKSQQGIKLTNTVCPKLNNATNSTTKLIFNFNKKYFAKKKNEEENTVDKFSRFTEIQGEIYKEKLLYEWWDIYSFSFKTIFTLHRSD